MATVTDAVASGRFVSVELLPPRSPAGEEPRRAAREALAPLAPAFVAVTYGANGSDRGRTESLVKQLAGTAATAVPHLTCAAPRALALGSPHPRRAGASVARPPVPPTPPAPSRDPARGGSTPCLLCTATRHWPRTRRFR